MWQSNQLLLSLERIRGEKMTCEREAQDEVSIIIITIVANVDHLKINSHINI